MLRFYRQFMVITSILVICLVVLTIFAGYVHVYAEDMRKLTIQRQAEWGHKTRIIRDTPINLNISQSKILGYKETPFIPWTADAPKPPKATILDEDLFLHADPIDPSITCIDNECRWLEL